MSSQFETGLEAELGVVEAPTIAPDLSAPAYVTRWRHLLALLKASRLLQFGVAMVLIALFLTVFGPMLAPHSTVNASCAIYAKPSSGHWFGCDSSGLDVFSRTIAAPRVDVSIALAATLLSMITGTLIGLLASYFRGWAGELVMRGSDTIQAFPLFVLAIVFVVLEGRHDYIIVTVVALLNVPIYLRLTRSEVLSLRERTFVEAAKANGDRSMSIALRHVMPNAMTSSFAQMPITFGMAIIVTAGLSFIGAGVQPPTAEWGAMINSGRADLQLGYWWTSMFPGIALSLTVFGFAVLGDAARTVALRRGA